MVGSVLAFVLLFWLIKRMKVSETPLIPLANTLVAILLGRLVLGEELTASASIGAAATLSGLLLARSGPLVSKRRTS